MRQRRGEEEHENHERWLISYADFITLLFTFFVALYALSSVDKAKVEQFSGSLKESFKVIEEPIPLMESRNRAIVDDLNKALQGVSGVSVKRDFRGVVVTFSDAVLFASGSADLKPEATGPLEKLSATLSGVTSNKMIIEGHTDNVPLSGGKYSSNWELSTARAASVLQILLKKGLDPNRFSLAGYAEYRPIAENATEEGRAKNRRVELVIGK